MDHDMINSFSHTPADQFTFASDLNKLLYWAKTWQMDFNVSKCAVLSVTAKRNISAYNYTPRKLSPYLLQKCSREPPSKSCSH